MNLKLAVVSHQPLSTLGGVSIHLKQLTEALVKIGVDVEVIAPAFKSDGFVQSSSYSFQVKPIFLKSRLQTMKTLEFSYRVYKYLLENKRRFDAIHGSQWSNLFVIAHKEELRIPIVTKMHGTTFYLLKKAFSYKPPCIYRDIGWFITAPLYLCVESFILKRSDGIICISRSVLNEVSHLIRTENKNQCVIYNGIDYKTFRPLEDEYIYKLKQQAGLSKNDKCILYVGRIEPMKGLHYLINSIKKLSKTIPRLKLVIVGDLNENPKYAKYLYSLAEPKENFMFLGKISHRYLPAIYNMCDVFVSPSLYEALGNTVLEAMACGKPVIVSNIGGLRELVKHYSTGFLIDIEYFEELLPRYLTLLLSDDDLLQQFGKRARKFVIENFSWEKTAIQTINFISRIIH